MITQRDTGCKSLLPCVAVSGTQCPCCVGLFGYVHTSFRAEVSAMSLCLAMNKEQPGLGPASPQPQQGAD